MNRAPALVACVALLLGGLLTGCFASKETRQGADRLVLVYDDMPGVAGVRVQSGRDGQGAEFVETVVTLEADATTAEVTDLVLGHDARVDDAGLADGFSYRGLRLEYDATGRPSLTMRWLGPAEAAVVRSGVEHWFRVTSLVGPAIQLVLGSDGSELYGVQPADSHTVADVYSTLAADPEIGPGRAAWDVTSHDGVALRLAIQPLPTPAQLSAWDTMVEAIGMLPPSYAAVRLDVSVGGLATVDVDLAAPEGMTKEQLTPAAYGGQLWPALRRQLDVVADLHPRWGYFVQWAPADSETTQTSLVSLLSDKDPVDNGDETYRWSKAAQDYVQKR